MAQEKVEVEYLPIESLIAYSNNPRKNDQAVETVAKSIQEFGFINPIIIDKENVIVAGHTRVKAAVSLGLTEVPVIWADDLTPEQIKAFRIMDNKSSELADWDFSMLKIELDEIKTLNYDVALTGFNESEIKNLDNFLESNPKEINENIEVEHECPSCGYKW